MAAPSLDGATAKQEFQSISQELEAMLVWWCSQPGKEEDDPCIARKMRDASPEDRAAWRETQSQTRNVTHAVNVKFMMHEQWCALDNHKESKHCEHFLKHIHEMKERRRNGGMPPPQKADGIASRRAEHIEMLTAYCTEGGG